MYIACSRFEKESRRNKFYSLARDLYIGPPPVTSQGNFLTAPFVLRATIIRRAR